MGWDRRDWLAVLFLTILATALRVYKLGEIPPGFHFDEAYNALDAALILSGDRPLFLPANLGREVAYSYYQAALAALFGLDRTTLRLASALAGIATIPAGYLLLRGLLRRNSQLVALFAMTALATSLWHLHFSHYGIRVITMPLIFSALFGSFWWGLKTPVAWRRGAAFALSGLAMGLAVWTHPSGRLTPIVLLAFVLYLFLRRPADAIPTEGPSIRSRALRGLVVTGIVSLVIFLPLGRHFLDHPEFFLSHAAEVSIFNQAVGGESPLLTALRQTGRVAGMFTWRGAQSWTHNFYGRPVFDPLLSAPFLLGVLLWVRRAFSRADEDRGALALLGFWVLVMLATSVLSDDAPDFSRTTTAQPAIFTAVGLGLTELLLWLNRRRARLGTGVAVGLLLISGVWSAVDYFVRFPRHLEEYYTLYAVDKIEAVEALGALAKGDDAIYLSQLWGDFATVRFMGEAYDITSVDMGDALVLPPPGQGAVYAFPYEQRNRAVRLAALWPDVAPQEILDSFGHGLLWAVQVDAATLADWPPARLPETRLAVDFVEGPTLQGVRMEDETLQLYWQADEAMLRDLTTFIHLIDSAGRRVGQLDRQPAGGSYTTPRWGLGERVIDRYRPALADPCAAGEPLRVQVGWYELAADGLRRPRADGLGDSAYVGDLTSTAPALSAPARDEALAAARPVDGPTSEQAELAAYRLDNPSPEPGERVTVDLFWRAGTDGAVPNAALIIENAEQAAQLWSGPAVARAEWTQDELYCRRVFLQLPAESAPGAAALQVTVDGEAPFALHALDVQPSTRQFTAPRLRAPLAIEFGAEMRLLGVVASDAQPDANGEDQTLDLTLAWQAVQPMAADYKVFVHVVDNTGRIFAQSDAAPGDGAPTSGWLEGEIVLDTHTISLPAGGLPAAYGLVIGLYDPITGLRLPVTDAGSPNFATVTESGDALRLDPAAVAP